MALTVRECYSGDGDRTETDEHMVCIVYTKVSDIGDTLSKCSLIRELVFTNTQLFDLKPLSTISTLRRLDLAYTKIHDIKDLAPLIQLESLDLTATRVTDITPLKDMTNLQHLTLTQSTVKDITPLANCKELNSLNLHNTEIESIEPLRGHTSLQTLIISCTDLVDVDAISTLTGLVTLHASSCDAVDFSSVSKITKLETLDLSDTSIDDVSVLVNGFQQLNFINIQGTKVTDITPLFDLPFIKTVYLPSTIKLNLPLFPSHLTGSITIGEHTHVLSVRDTGWAKVDEGSIDTSMYIVQNNIPEIPLYNKIDLYL